MDVCLMIEGQQVTWERWLAIADGLEGRDGRDADLPRVFDLAIPRIGDA